MKINMDKNLVEFTPENADETKKLEALWKVLVDCMRFNRKMVPVGEFVPGKTDKATFAIEGQAQDSDKPYPEVYADDECRAYCQTCNKYVELKKGDQIPPCCGKLMEVLD